MFHLLIKIVHCNKITRNERFLITFHPPAAYPHDSLNMTLYKGNNTGDDV